MSKIVIIADKNLCENLSKKILNFCENDAFVVLRQKDLNQNEYEKFALQILEICKNYKEQIFLHNFIEVAKKIEHKNIWLPLEILKNCKNLSNFDKIVTSTHDENEVKQALNFGTKSVCLSHIFETSCKAGLKPKGINFIKDIKKNFNCEIFALGGINFKNYKDCLEAGADKICFMSSAMKCQNEKEFLQNFKG